MAAPMAIMLRSILLKNRLLLSNYSPALVSQTCPYFWRKKKEEIEDEVQTLPVKDGPTTISRLQSLKKKTSVRTKKAYTPPTNLEDRLSEAVREVCGVKEGDWKGVQLTDRRVKFKLLTRLMRDFDHDIPNLELHNMNTTRDVLRYFSKPVRDTSTFEDLSKLNLPKNMHIQLEPLRFDPETDTMFGGKTAFPGSKTIVSGLRYKRKYGKTE